MEGLPKVLVNALETLCGENNLLSWNISSHGNSTNISIKFVESSHFGSDITPGHSYRSTGLRGKSPGQLRRDRDTYYANREENNSISMPFYHPVRSTPINVGETHVSQPLYSPVEQSVNSNTPMATYEGHDQSTIEEASINNSTDCNALNTFDVLLNNVDSLSDIDNSNDNAEVLEETRCSDVMSSQIEPELYFSKVITDYRSSVEYITYRGLTHTGDIVSYEPRNPNQERNLHVLEAKKYYTDPHFSNLRSIIDKFPDKSKSSEWKKGVTILCEKYARFIQDRPSDGSYA